MAQRERICGIETEYALHFFPDEGSKQPGATAIINLLCSILGKDYGSSQHEFLVTGARLYADLGHVEWALPECSSAREALAYDKAADQILALVTGKVETILMQKGYHGKLRAFKNNVDSVGTTYGCHENYFTLRESKNLSRDRFLHYLIRCLIPFLVTRQLFTGSGRLIIGERSGTKQPHFVLSQRSEFINAIVSRDTTRNRAIINLSKESESLAGDNARRLHLILGDANLSAWATWMKLGLTSILIRMIEDMFFKDILVLNDPLGSLKIVSQDLSCRIPLTMRHGPAMTAVEIQWHYYRQADAYLKQASSTDDEDRLMVAWKQALIDVEDDPMKLQDRADWAIKKQKMDKVLAQEGLSWDSLPATIPQLQYHDLIYHYLSDKGYFQQYCQSHPEVLNRWITPEEIQRATNTPPRFTRAYIRGMAVALGRQNKADVKVKGWFHIVFNDTNVSIVDPFEFDHAILAPFFPFDQAWWDKAIVPQEDAVYSRAIRYLGWYHDAASLAILLDIVRNDKNAKRRRIAIEALGQRAEQSVKNLLIECLKDPMPGIRWAAEEALDLIAREKPIVAVVKRKAIIEIDNVEVLVEPIRGA